MICRSLAYHSSWVMSHFSMAAHYFFFPYHFYYLYSNNCWLSVRFHLSSHRYYTINLPMVCYYFAPNYRLRHFSSLHYIGFTATPFFTIWSSIITAIWAVSIILHISSWGSDFRFFKYYILHLAVTWFSYLRCLALELYFFH